MKAAWITMMIVWVVLVMASPAVAGTQVHWHPFIGGQWVDEEAVMEYAINPAETSGDPNWSYRHFPAAGLSSCWAYRQVTEYEGPSVILVYNDAAYSKSIFSRPEGLPHDPSMTHGPDMFSWTWWEPVSPYAGIWEEVGRSIWTPALDLPPHAAVIELVEGDANMDGEVSLSDLSTLAANWGFPAAGISGWGYGDFDGDGSVSLSDLSAMASNWGAEGVVIQRPFETVPLPESIAVLLVGSILGARSWRCRSGRA